MKGACSELWSLVWEFLVLGQKSAKVLPVAKLTAKVPFFFQVAAVRGLLVNLMGQKCF